MRDTLLILLNNSSSVRDTVYAALVVHQSGKVSFILESRLQTRIRGNTESLSCKATHPKAHQTA
jgi:hypothetical protein